MFNFLKKLKPQHEIPELEQQLTIREQAIQIFSQIEGLDDIKEMMLRALESSQRAHTLLTGGLVVYLPSANIQLGKFQAYW